MDRTPFLGLDLGGSSVKVSLLAPSDGTYEVTVAETWPLDGDRSPGGVVSTIRSILDRFRWSDDFGLAIPGIIDADRGLSLVLPNFPPEWTGHHIVDAVVTATARRPQLINDAKAFSLAETTMGAGRGWNLVACLVLGTGVGGGVVHHGRLWHGGGTAGEFGHIIVDLDGPRCGCGSRGCVEAFAGADAIERSAGTSTTEDAFRAAAAGDPRAVQSIDRATSALADAMASISATIAPDVFVIGGGLAAAGDPLFDPLIAKFHRQVNIIPRERLRVFRASLGREAGSIGAALHSLDMARDPADR